MTTSEHRTWLSSVAFLDVVNFSERSIQEQLDIKQHLDSVLRDQLHSVGSDDYMLLDRGDGAAVCFLVEPEAAFFFALHMRDNLRLERVNRPRYEIRVGINLGPIKIIRDANGDRAPVGEGINSAARVMDFAGPNEVLVARSFYDVIGCQSREYAELFSYLGVRADKHVREFELYEVVSPGTPKRVAPPASAAHGAKSFDHAYLDRVQHALAHAIGPMADLLLSRAVQRVESDQELLTCLSTALQDPEQRTAFYSELGMKAPPLEHSHHTDPRPIPAHPHAAVTSPVLRPELVDHARLALTQHLGPIALVLVKQSAAAQLSETEFVESLADRLPDAEARDAFMAQMELALKAPD